MGHPTHEYQALAISEVVNVGGSFDRGNYQIGNNFNSMGQMHPGFSWNSPSGILNSWQQNNSRPQGQGAPGFQNQQRLQYHPPRYNQSSMEDLMKAFIIKTDESLETHNSAIREHGTLPANTKRNPKETINAVSLMSGHELEDPIAKKKDEPIERHVEFMEEQKNDNMQKGAGMVHVNISFTEVLSQMPDCAKFLKQILPKKRKFEETSVVQLTEHCSAIFQNKLPQKCGDPESSIIPCSLGSTKIKTSLCDPGDSINHMPFSIFRKLEGEIREIRSIPVSLQLVDQTTIILEGIVEDVLVRVDKCLFPVDFIVVKMEENREVPLILGRPFLATSRAILDIQER
uniref:Uncharacterized protein n=1 Tax=Nicotiana tabacum TaxID=4097 RepID=A0A1S3ZFP4_TOBAC|nr:PREDICTED: uncharacterized protein LOC107786323 [Nicotiana tabacum]